MSKRQLPEMPHARDLLMMLAMALDKLGRDLTAEANRGGAYCRRLCPPDSTICQQCRDDYEANR
jgi:hypothetical protein